MGYTRQPKREAVRPCADHADGGDVSKFEPTNREWSGDGNVTVTAAAIGIPQVTERSFEDYHLYTLPRPKTLRDRENKQAEFMRASGISSRKLYVYEGAVVNSNQYGWEQQRIQPEFGITQSNGHVWVVREFANSEANHLGMPLPKGRVRFYRRDQDGQLEFTGENEIDHTAKDETVHLYTGNAFDIAGERKQTAFHTQQTGYPNGFTDESFEIKLRNHEAEATTVKVVGHLYRWINWTISQESDVHKQSDERTIEYEVTLQPDQEKTVSYTVHYSW